MAKTIAIVGAGRVGQTLGRALRRRGYRIGSVVTQSARTTRRAARFIGAGQPEASLTPKIARASIVLLATPDPTLASLARQLARWETRWRGKVVLHASGTQNARVLEPVRRRGAAIGSMHPIFPFSQPLKEFPRGVFFGIEGDRRGVKRAKALVCALGGVPVTVRSTRKSLYHAAAALSAGQLMTLFDLASRALSQAGVPRAQARQALLPLAQATLDAYAQQGERSWVGPLARGEARIVKRHLAALGKLSRRHREVYALLGRAALELYRGKGSKRGKQWRRLLGP
ncbi:MAG: Rossmann-like and DUF2520 domain-containing protein [Terriglobia bacterium]